MKQWYKVIDVARCHDCNNCFMADKDEFVGNDWPALHGRPAPSRPPLGGHPAARAWAVRAQRRSLSPGAVPALRERAVHRRVQRRCHPPSRRHRDDRHGEGQGQQGPGRLLPVRRHLVERGARHRPEVHLLRTPDRRSHLEAAHHPVHAFLPDRRHGHVLRRAGRDAEDDRGRGPGSLPGGAGDQAAHPLQEPVQVHQELHHRRRAGRRRLLRGRHR